MVPLRKQVAELRLFQTARLGNQQRVGGEPARRCQRSRGAWQQAGLIGRIQKHQTTGGARRGAECIGRNHTRLGAGAGREIETQRLQGRAIPLHEGGMGRPAGKGFQAERSGSGKRIQNGDAVEPTAPGRMEEDVEQCLPEPFGGRPGRGSHGGAQPFAAPTAADNPQRAATRRAWSGEAGLGVSGSCSRMILPRISYT